MSADPVGGTGPARPVIERAAARLTDAGVASPRHDAEALAAHVLGVPSALVGGAELTETQLRAYETLVDERARRVPLQHLIGRAGFRYLDLEVGPGVFVPRPETEVLVSWGLDAVRDVHRPVVVDLCTGSGAIALAVAQERPDAVVHAVERSELAMAWAERNAAARVAAGDRPVRLHRGDATDPRVLAELDRTVDLVLSNPPYIPEGSSVEPEVAEHDPAAALWGGSDGLQVLGAVAARARLLVRDGGWFGVEHADVQGSAVTGLLRSTGWADVSCHRDLAARPRFTTGRAVRD